MLELEVDPVRWRVTAFAHTSVAESFFATLKVELVHDELGDGAGAGTEVFEYIEGIYNGQRRHSALGYLSPRAFERQRAQQRSAA